MKEIKNNQKQAKTRRQIRKVNRKIAVDAHKYQRRRYKIILAILVVFMIMIEAFVMGESILNHYKDEAKQISENLSLQLSAVNSSIMMGDQPRYDANISKLHETMDELSKNLYMKSSHADTVSELEEYVNRLDHDKNTIRALISYRAAISQFESDLNQSENIAGILASLRVLQNQLELLKDNGSANESDLLAATITAHFDYNARTISKLESLSNCTNVCSNGVIDQQRETINDAIKRYRKGVAEINFDDLNVYNSHDMLVKIKEIMEE